MDHLDFLANITYYGVALSHQWEIRLTPPIQTDANQQMRLVFSCENITTPGKTLITSERKTYQITSKMPYGQMYDDVQATFRCSSDMNELKFFTKWQDSVQDKYTKNFNYFHEYTTDIFIVQYDNNKKPIYAVKLKDAYPNIVGELQNRYQDDGDYHRFMVSFTYAGWERVDEAGFYDTSSYSSPNTGVSNFIKSTGSGISNSLTNIFSL